MEVETKTQPLGDTLLVQVLCDRLWLQIKLCVTMCRREKQSCLDHHDV